jgi:5-methylcytosine-specific restriction endonuclease McrA
MSVLWLNSTYEPLGIISWEDAMQMIVTGDGEAVVELEAPVRSAKQEWKLPSVVRQFKEFKKGKGIQFSRINVYTRDNWTCQYCGKKKSNPRELTFDHVLPKCQGGKTNWKNIVTACKKCNSKKDDKTPEQARMVLLSEPVKPGWLPQTVVINLKNIPVEWEPYIDKKSMLQWKKDFEEK